MSTIRISTLPVEQIDQVRPLIEKYQRKPHRFLQRDIQGTLDSFWMMELTELSRSEQGAFFVATEKDEPMGMVAYSDLPWDTRVIGNRMGSLKYVIAEPDSPQQREIIEQLLDYVMEWSVSRGIESLLCKTYSDDIPTVHALERKGFLLMDALLDYVYDLQRDPLHIIPRPPLRQGYTIRSAGIDDAEKLMAMARVAFRDHIGRFHSDERITKHRATRVYEEWMRASCQGYADWILVAEIDKRIVGCSIWKRPATLEQSQGIQLGHYSIGAVHPDHHGQGLFSALTHAGMELFDGIANYIEGPTHINNYPVQRAYTKLHWRICDARYSFHRWLEE